MASVALMACLNTALGTAAVPPPDIRLLTIIVVDQMRGDYLPRFARHFGKDGFNRLAREGADFRSVYYSYGSTSTAPGHATISTGRLPRRHGIVANEWWLDPELRTIQAAVYDPQAGTVGIDPEPKPPGMSPWRLNGPSLGDELKLADARSRVFAVSLKDRAAILLAGRHPDAAYWWDPKSGHCVSSTWYMDRLPPYMASFNSERIADRFAGKPWDLLLPAESYAGCQPLDPAWILDDYGLGKSFPHVPAVAENDRKQYRSLLPTPFGNDIVVDLVRRIIENEKPGTRGVTDMLCVSFSSNDYTGHLFGPDSREMMDMTIRTDRHIETLLNLLDGTVGLEHCLIALTADHGIKPIPDLAKAHRLGGGRLPDQETLSSRLNDLLTAAAGPLPAGRPYVLGAELPWVYFDPSFSKLEPSAREKLTALAADHVRGLEGVAAVFTASELADPPPSPEDYERWLAWRCYCPGRSGELYLQEKPYYYDELDKTTGHGTTCSFDRHVPLLLRGPGIHPGRYFTPVDPMDIPVTLAALVGIEKPLDAEGRVLSEAITTSPGGGAPASPTIAAGR